MDHSIFQVNLSGILKVLSDSLYSSWEVFMRELLQNANDAIIARQQLESFQARIKVSFFENEQERVLIIKDNGIGLRAEEMKEFLSKIGSSSKSNVTDLFDREQQGFIGQFGIGLLSCFMVSDQIQVESTSAQEAKTTIWKGNIDGTYQIEDTEYNETVGTKVRLKLKDHIDLHDEKIKFLLDQYGSYLLPPIEYTYNLSEEELFSKKFPWETSGIGNNSLRIGKVLFNEQFNQFFPISDETGSTKGIAYILPRPTHTGAVSQHAVYVKRMFVSQKTDKILPDWAFFIRAVINSTNLSTTASREDIYENETLTKVKIQLGESIKSYLHQLSKEAPDELRTIIHTHSQALKSLALADDEFFHFIIDWFIFPTTDGVLSLKEIRQHSNTILFVSDLDEFRQISPIAKTNGQLIVNAGYIYDTPILKKLSSTSVELNVRQIDAAFFGEILEDIDLTIYDQHRSKIEAMQYALIDYNVQLDLKHFSPEQLPAMLYMNQEQVEKRDFEEIKKSSNVLWGSISDAMLDFAPVYKAKLFLNYANPIAQKLFSLSDPKSAEPYVRMIYFNALMMGHYPMTSQELTDMNSTILELINNSL